MSRNQKIIFWAILAAAVFLLFFRLGRQDMLGDDGHYAFRALGYFDYMNSQNQTTPVQWFGSRPAWSFLSFHDHPPLVFLIQHIFFKLFGASVAVSRLPAALAAFGTVLLIFFLGRELRDARLGLLAAAALVINNYFIWTGRIGLLESVAVLFLMWGIYHLIKAIQGQDRHFLPAGAFFGLSFLSKYTILFILPGFLVYFLWRGRAVFANKKFWWGMALFLLIASPVVIYNFSMLHFRGHFDVQFAGLFRQTAGDWPILAGRGGFQGWNLAAGLTALGNGLSWPYFGLLGLALPAVVYLASRRRLSDSWLLLGLALASLLIGLFVVGAAPRWLGAAAPLSALLVAALAEIFWRKTQPKKLVRFLSAGAGALLVAYSVFYILNTNTFFRPFGSRAWYAKIRVENYGYNQIDKEIAEIFSDKPASADVAGAVGNWWHRGIRAPAETEFHSSLPAARQAMVVYDSFTGWFPMIWIAGRWRFYHGNLIMSAEEFSKISTSPTAGLLDNLGITDLYLIESGSEVARAASVSASRPQPDGIKRADLKIVSDDLGREAFRIYHKTFK